MRLTCGLRNGGELPGRGGAEFPIVGEDVFTQTSGTATRSKRRVVPQSYPERFAGVMPENEW